MASKQHSTPKPESADPFTPPVAMIGGNLRFIAVTHAFAAVLNTMSDQLIGRSITELCDISDPKDFRKQIRYVMSGELTHIEREQNWTRPSGQPVRAKLLITPAMGLDDEIYCAIAKITPLLAAKQSESPDDAPHATESDTQVERIRKAMLW